MAKSLVMKQIREHCGIPDEKVKEVKTAFEKGGIVSVVGPHGSGKTGTTVRLIPELFLRFSSGGIVNRALQELSQSVSLCVMRTSGYFGIDHDQTVQSLYLQNQVSFLFCVLHFVDS
jgi:ABC-type Na+ transport system ATPase subunit NatA